MLPGPVFSHSPPQTQVGDLLEQFASVEEKFQQAGATEQEMIDALRKSYANNHQVGGWVCVLGRGAGRSAGGRDGRQWWRLNSFLLLITRRST